MMQLTRLTAITTAALVLTLAGCGLTGSAYVAKEERSVSAVHEAGSPLRVTTRNGSVRIAADPARNDVAIVARIVAAGDSQEEADLRLAAVEVRVERLADGSLSIVAVLPEPRRGQDGCAFDIRLPDAVGVTVETSNGSIALSDLGGEAVAQTSNGAVTVLRQGGGVRVQTSNGRVQVADPGGPVDVRTSNGAVDVLGSRGAVTVNTSNGSVTCLAQDGASDAIRIHTSNGPVTLDVPRSLGGRISATTSNGSIRITGSTLRTVGTEGSRTMHIADEGPESTIQTSNGVVSVTIRDVSTAPPTQ